tara:strand:+ start:136 stop:1923 length:1788 start_codon:yes stop_codon:yes gene_type:complete
MVDPSLVCPSVTAPAAHSPNIWLLGRGPDLLLVIATPALVIPAMFGCLGLGLSTAAQLNEWVMTFGAQGHHLPGMVRAYGDRQLFHRFRFRFIAAPALLAAACMTCAVYEFQSLIFMAFLWGIWHAALQSHGFARIYDAKWGCTDARTARLDLLLVLVGFSLVVLLSPGRLQFILQMMAQAGFSLPSVQMLSDVKAMGIALGVIVGFLWLSNAVHSYAQGRGPSPAKVLLLVSSIGTWAWANIAVSNILLALPLFEVFHDIQYLTIVWLFNRQRAKGGASLGPLSRRLFAGGALGLGLYVLLCLAYGALPPIGDSGSTTYGLTSGLLAASQLLHFYYDGFIWKLSHDDTRRDLGIDKGHHAATQQKRQRWGHGLRWLLLFVVPATLLILGESQNTKPAHKIHVEVANLVPDSALAQAFLGGSMEAKGRDQEALDAYLESSRLDPDFSPPREAVFKWLERWPERTSDEPTNLSELRRWLGIHRQATARSLNDQGVRYAQSQRPREALRSWRLSSLIDPTLAEAFFNQAGGLARERQIGAALNVLEEGLRLETNPKALELQKMLRSQQRQSPPKFDHENIGHPSGEREAQNKVKNSP